MYVHKPLPLHEEKALESAYEGKPVIEKKALFTVRERPYIHSGGFSVQCGTGCTVLF